MTREIDKTARMTYKYDHIRKQIIIKLMPGTIHEVMAIEFFCKLKYVTDLLPGHTRHSITNNEVQCSRYAPKRETWGVSPIRRTVSTTGHL